ncbi:hypothetical protein SAMN02745218_01521 [Desulfofundulus australicus DSM 11792]|uniref:Uncharacterized protein n=1 Tax=Desulfofundulus australicus DSM 11792 TaxID=1121425 RepID=A0A1M4Z7U2_9FIRM|nr:hypothetical protein SAMN02745218_01521 [Desulfofundulus australicus DSM 11792]
MAERKVVKFLGEVPATWERSKEYCSPTCKHSAKSHRYRVRQKLKLLRNAST